MVDASHKHDVPHSDDQVWLNMLGGFKRQLPDVDPQETQEWIESLDMLVKVHGRERADFVLRKLLKRARQLEVGTPGLVRSRYINTISSEQEPSFPGDEAMEKRIRRIIRWNAAVLVLKANRLNVGLGGHLATYASSASLYEVGFNHFFRGRDDGQPGDQIFFQGHAAPGIYSRAFLEGRLSEAQLDHFRREVGGGGLSSYPHPRLMPDFWEFPTVSMGLGPLNAVYQARFNRYLLNRGITDTSQSRVFAFLGDGECDEPEALAAARLAAREELDNLTFVVNCNLQRLDGPVRGNGKIIQELESAFTGAGWNVIKVIWGSAWDPLLAKDIDGALVERMNSAVDGDYQKYITESGAYIREKFFGTDPRLQEMVADLTDEQIRTLRRGGHDYRKLYAAYAAAVNHTGRPTVILAKTVKGWTLGETAEASNTAHNVKALNLVELKKFRDRISLPIPDSQLDDPPFFHPGAKSEEVQYLMERRSRLGGAVPRRIVVSKPLPMPPEKTYQEFDAGTPADQEVSTTMAFGRLLAKLLRDQEIGKRIVPVIPDEGRTFGLEALFSQVGIYAPGGQLYEPVDSRFVLKYSEATDGQILEEGITEAGSMGSFTAAGTAYATHGEPMIPFYIFYSMFGFQRTMDSIWAFSDARGRGFLLGATAGRTTLNGEGLQHQDGHSHVLANATPFCLAYDPAFAFELALIIEDGLTRMYEKEEDVFYYITLYNENYSMPAKPEGVDDGILKGIYRFRAAPIESELKVRLFGSGTLLREALRAQEILAETYGVAADVYSVTSYSQLLQDGEATERWNRLHPGEALRTPYIQQTLAGSEGPIVAVSDFLKSHAASIARFVPGRFIPLGTDGFGRSDTRASLRQHFEISAEHVVVSALTELTRAGKVDAELAVKAVSDFAIDPEVQDPRVA